jgi:hypothetical protein
MAASTTVCFGFTEVAGITVYCQLHVTTVESKDCFFLSGKVVKKLSCLSKSVFGGAGRLGGDGTYWY